MAMSGLRAGVDRVPLLIVMNVNLAAGDHREVNGVAAGVHLHGVPIEACWPTRARTASP